MKRIGRARSSAGWEGDEKRATVVRGYRELHNSWPSHNGAAQGCERADGMSFSFVSSRGDYFSFHSFVSCRDSSAPFVAPSPPSPAPSPASLLLCPLFFSLRLTFYLLPRFSRRSFLTVVRVYADPPLFGSARPFLSLTRPSLTRRNRHRKVYYFTDACEKSEKGATRPGHLSLSPSLFVPFSVSLSLLFLVGDFESATRDETSPIPDGMLERTRINLFPVNSGHGPPRCLPDAAAGPRPCARRRNRIP